jgi:hypothetical protein
MLAWYHIVATNKGCFNIHSIYFILVLMVSQKIHSGITSLDLLPTSVHSLDRDTNMSHMIKNSFPKPLPFNFILRERWMGDINNPLEACVMIPVI